MPEEPGKKTGLKINTRYAGRLISCAIGAAIANGTALWFVDISSAPFLLSSIGGITVFLFSLTRGAAAQPRAAFGVHLGGTIIAVVWSQLIPGMVHYPVKWFDKSPLPSSGVIGMNK